MTTRRTSPTLAMIALAIAAALALSSVGEASACSSPAPAKARGCCAKRVQPACGCCKTPQKEKEEAVAPKVDLLASLSPVESESGPSCGCLPADPAAPTERRTVEPRSESSTTQPAAVAFEMAPVAATALERPTSFDPLPRPVYLRTSRLRF
ncbi:hypothetical protein [Paludisphaera rhizosphaerae]|uniref:hypothetical protein n=1 Tax=Paludisphaera rhizosphaerae TaxID=2711216 RepID=UPI0013EB849E|nr:hypothetical protein [Paludisphaera rhizosphaerae]